jgi:hypothetical protein
MKLFTVNWGEVKTYTDMGGWIILKWILDKVGQYGLD